MILKIITFLKRKVYLAYYKKIKFSCIGKNVVLDDNISFAGYENISIGDNVFIGKDSTIQCFEKYKDTQYTPVCKIGNNVSFTKRVTIYCAQSVVIGNGCMIGSDVLITDENHGTDPRNNYRDNPLETKPVFIGTDTWIGDKVVILPGAEIGNHSIIGAGTIVTKSVPDYCVFAGNPGKVIKTWNKTTNSWETAKS